MRRKNPFNQPLTPDQALAAQYIDFEGGMDKPPVLFGVQYFEGRKHPDRGRPVLRQWIVDPAFEELSGRVEIPRFHVHANDGRGLLAAISDVVGRAEQQDRLIVAWSEHEHRLLEELGIPQELLERFAARYRNARAIAQRWRNLCHPNWVPDGDAGKVNRLQAYLAFIGHEVPAEHQGGDVGATIRDLAGAFEKGRGWDDLTPRRQQRWRDVVWHNFHDCNGMRAVIERAADELAARAP